MVRLRLRSRRRRNPEGRMSVMSHLREFRRRIVIILLIIAVSIAPSAIHIWRENGDEIKAQVRAYIARRRVKTEPGDQ